jgi:hypothetical protein
VDDAKAWERNLRGKQPMPKRAHAASEGDPPLQRYISGAAALVASINDNENDLRFVDQQGGRIIYLIDANALLFCLRPEREARQLEMLPLENRYVRQSIAELASMHMLEAAFSGQQQSAPLFLLGPHVGEVNRKLEGLVTELKSSSLGEEAKKERAGSLKRYSDWRRSDRVASFEGSIWYTEAIRNRIRSQSDEGNQKDRNRPSRSALSKMLSKAVKENYEAETGQLTSGNTRLSFPSENVKADISVLLDLIELNSLFALRPQPIRFCLITADRRLHHAVATIFYSNEPIELLGVTFRRYCGEALPTRFIGQYHPTLSIGPTPGNSDQDSRTSLKSVFQEILDVFGYKPGQSKVLHFYSGPHAFHPSFWDWYKFVHKDTKSTSLNDDLPERVPFSRLVDDSIARANKMWARANEETVRANQDKLDAQRVVTENERNTALKNISNILAEFEVENFGLLLNYYCWSYLQSIQTSKEASSVSGARFGVPTSFDFGLLTDGRLMESFIEGLGTQDVVNTVPILIDKLRHSETDDAVRRLCVGCLALGVAPGTSEHDASTQGSIRVAQELFLEVARRLHAIDPTSEQQKMLLASNTKTDLAIESLHLLGFAQRVMAICEIDSMAQTAGHGFDRQLDEAEKHVLTARDLALAANLEMSVWRADSEAAALACTRLLYQLRASRSLSGRSGSRIQPESLLRLANEASVRLDAILRLMLNDALRDRVTKSIRLASAEDRHRFYDDVLLQALTNSLCYQWLSCGCGHALPQLDRKRLTLALDRMEKLQGGRYVSSFSFSVSRINYLAACASIGRKPAVEDDGFAALQDLARKADERTEDPHADLPLTTLDLDELRYLASPAFAKSVRRFATPNGIPA